MERKQYLLIPLMLILVLFSSGCGKEQTKLETNFNSQENVDAEGEIDTSGWETYSTENTLMLLYKDLKNQFNFKYPTGWYLDETKGGIEVYSFKPDMSYGIGTLTDGTFKIEIIPEWNNDENLEISAWCNKLIRSHLGDFQPEIFQEEYLKVGNKNSYMIDYQYKEAPQYNVREICIPLNNNYMTIVGYPLNPEYLKIFDKVISTFNFQ